MGVERLQALVGNHPGDFQQLTQCPDLEARMLLILFQPEPQGILEMLLIAGSMASAGQVYLYGRSRGLFGEVP